MWNPFRTEMPVRSGDTSSPRELGFPGESFDFPRMVDTSDPVGVSELTEAGDGSPFRGVVDDRFQATNPDYAGEYHPGFVYGHNPVPQYAPTNPAPGSVDLAFARNTGEVTGTDRLITNDGPVGGGNSEWTGQQGRMNFSNPNYAGPVTGGPDYSQQLSAAYFQSVAVQAAQEYANAAMVSAV